MFTLSFTPRGEHTLLFTRTEGQTGSSPLCNQKVIQKEKRHFLPEIAEDCDKNIGPWSKCTEINQIEPKTNFFTVFFTV
jgi:hypothetical protein